MAIEITGAIPDRPLDGRKVLLVEGALDLLLEETPDCAVLDLNLGGETSEAIAFDLERLGIPYVFATGYRDSVSIPDRFAGVPVVRKPLAEGHLAIALHNAIKIPLAKQQR